jgi:DNA-binding MarR family transcriptional regulator/GNAT superfamily N-acetyltransferase
MVETVRSFNRSVTQRIGVLTDRYLGRNRPLADARVLWEIGERGCDVRALRRGLNLDSGYLSRLLRSLEAAGLVKVSASASDGRVRAVHLTKKGRAERLLLDDRSEALAQSILAPLSPAQQQRLVAAMAEVDKLLVAAAVEIGERDPSHPSARYCLAEYYAELDRRFAIGFDPDAGGPSGPDELTPPAGTFLVATLDGEPVGCGALRFHPSGITEIKRLWVAPPARGMGLGRRLLDELEARALQRGSGSVCLDTNRALGEAIAMYRRAGYVEIAPFNDNPYADYWFEKSLQ